MDWYVVFLLLIGIMVVLMLIGLPIAVSMGLVSVAFLIWVSGFGRGMATLGAEVVDIWSNYALTAVPMFIFMGEFLFASGTAADILDLAAKWLRRLPGGVAMSAIGAGAIFATLSGSSMAGVSTIGLMAIPEMMKRGYSRRLCAGAVASAGGLAHLIPPSILAIIYASITEVSMGRQLMAGFFPGFLVASLYGLVIIVWVKVNPSAAPVEPPIPWKERVAVLGKSIWPLLMVLLVLGSIYFGLATVTEAAGLGALGALVITLVRRKLNWHIFWHALLATVQLTAFIMFLTAAGRILSWVLTYYLVPQHLVQLIVGTGLNRWLIMVLIQLMYIVLGMFIDPLGMIMVTVPILHPVLTSLGFDLIWFGVLLFINIEVALQTPPVGLSLYVIKGVAPQLSIADIMWGALIFDAAELAAIGIVMAFPQIALWLPSRMIG